MIISKGDFYMYQKYFVAIILTLFMSASAALGHTNGDSAEYRISFKGDWSRTNNHPSVKIPAIAHFSPLIGAIHNRKASVWRVGEKASKGFTLVAELGQNAKFRKELKSQTGKEIGSVLNGSGNVGTNQTDVISGVRATKEHPLLSLATMIAPSHDWFIGVSDLSLLDTNGEWKDRIEIDLFAYDAGTELGTDLALGPDKKENGVIRKLTGVSYLKNYKFGSLKIERVK